MLAILSLLPFFSFFLLPVFTIWFITCSIYSLIFNSIHLPIYLLIHLFEELYADLKILFSFFLFFLISFIFHGLRSSSFFSHLFYQILLVLFPLLLRHRFLHFLFYWLVLFSIILPQPSQTFPFSSFILPLPRLGDFVPSSIGICLRDLNFCQTYTLLCLIVLTVGGKMGRGGGGIKLQILKFI